VSGKDLLMTPLIVLYVAISLVKLLCLLRR